MFGAKPRLTLDVWIKMNDPVDKVSRRPIFVHSNIRYRRALPHDQMGGDTAIRGLDISTSATGRDRLRGEI